ncbi:hypothetical protein [Anaerotignum sp.]
MKLNYKNQLILSCVVILIFNVLNTVFQNWIFTSIGFCICGLLWMIHPVMMKNAVPSKKGLLAIRGCGVLLILIGLLTRSYFY